MALITCPECNGSTSDQATTCPRCGYPVRDVNLLAIEGDQPRAQAHLVELTAKRLKKHYAIAATLSVAAMLLMTGTCVKANVDQKGFWAVNLFAALFVASFLYLAAIKILIWWHHR